MDKILDILHAAMEASPAVESVIDEKVIDEIVEVVKAPKKTIKKATSPKKK